ncbi:type II toxin-antitoxin system RelE family toxin [Legionella londiniensis]|uniref:Toxin of the RelE-RelB toxin-antitoxin system n=1 Tax=Legionella londiniensis TaxID=45068 RepID=A0A0W0VJS7_9GAMM|nr:type II toxin-antitoxin system RelE/ParE family toxin [Legionella londiniensis]KTD20359.1 toxin of the RelE-RelB toxin-antitoxin system [Legionella londiniensis]STX93962.1 toxin of the RelE-RelB toxin-antitoxin system [Legionella londiniensis]
MTWKIEFDADVEKDLRKLGHTAQKRILTYLKEKVMSSNDPRSLGKSLSGDLTGLWRYRVGDYRILAKIEDNNLTILVVHVGHRKNVYADRQNRFSDK